MLRRDPDKAVLMLDNAVRILDLMLELFDGGKRWIRLGEYDDNGNFCLAGALEFISRVHSLRPDDALDCLLQAFGTPKPIQKPHPPIWLGGFTPAALRRAVRFGDGFIVRADARRL